MDYGCFEEGTRVDQSDRVVRHVAPADWAVIALHSPHSLGNSRAQCVSV